MVLRSSRGTVLVETGYLLPAGHSEFDMRFSVKAREHYLVATGPEDVEITSPDGTREHARVRTTDVPHYAPFVRDVLRRWREGEPPVASLDDLAAVMDLVARAYAVDAGHLPAAAGPVTTGGGRVPTAAHGRQEVAR